jgi:hypothetical protein
VTALSCGLEDLAGRGAIIEQGHEVGPREKGKKCVEMLEGALRRLGCDVTITPQTKLRILGGFSKEYNT